MPLVKLPFDRNLMPKDMFYIHPHPDEECIEFYDKNMKRVALWRAAQKDILITGKDLEEYEQISFSSKPSVK